MAFNYDSTDVPESMDGFDFPKPGEYHFQVNRSEMDDKDQLVIEAEVLAGNPPDQEGKVHKEWFNAPTPEQTPEKRRGTLKRQLAFFIAVGLTSEEELITAKKAGKGISIDEGLAVGRQFCGRLTAETYEGKTRNKLGFDMWPVNSQKAASIPLNKGMLEKNGEKKAVPAGGDVFGGDDDPF